MVSRHKPGNPPYQMTKCVFPRMHKKAENWTPVLKLPIGKCIQLRDDTQQLSVGLHLQLADCLRDFELHEKLGLQYQVTSVQKEIQSNKWLDTHDQLSCWSNGQMVFQSWLQLRSSRIMNEAVAELADCF